MGLSAQRAFDISEEIWRRDRDAEDSARHFGETHSELLARYLAIRESFAPKVYAQLPQWVHAKLSAGRRMTLDRIHSQEMTWILKVRADGTRAGKWDDLTEEERAEFRANRTQGAHYWTAHLPKLRPFNAGTNPHAPEESASL